MKALSSAGVVLPRGHTGSTLFHAVLCEAARQFPDALSAAPIPAEADLYKRDYGRVLARFEGERARCPQRVEIARFIVQRTHGVLEYASGDERVPLSAYLEQRVAAPALERTLLGHGGGLPIEVPFDGKLVRGRELLGLADQLYEAHHLTRAAHKALHWIVAFVEARGGSLDLRDQRFVMFGAGAELAPTRLLLRAGASVLWVDLAAPERALEGAGSLAGVVVRAPHARDLLEKPREIAAAIRAFASEGPVHLGLFAYAAGASQEWRLGAAMNAIAMSLEPELVRSISLLVSPTTVSVLQPESLQSAEQRLAQRPPWQGALSRLGMLEQPGHHQANGLRVSRSTVAVQGLSYQAAQYIAKIAAAETYAVYGTRPDLAPAHPTTVSSNVAGITRTRSLSHPLFEAAFAGAHHFGVRIFEPAATRALSGLLILHDLLNPEAPGAAAQQPADAREKAAQLASQQIHGGIYGLPYALDGVIRIAALVGLGQNPLLLLRKQAT